MYFYIQYADQPIMCNISPVSSSCAATSFSWMCSIKTCQPLTAAKNSIGLHGDQRCEEGFLTNYFVDLLHNCLEGINHIGGIHGWSLNERQVLFLCNSCGLFFCHLPSTVEVTFVSHKHHNNTRIRMHCK